MESGVHAVQPQGRRTARTAAGPPCRYGHGLRAAVHGIARQTEQLRHGCFPADDRPSWARCAARRYGDDPKSRCRHAGGRRPSARDRVLDRRRSASVECQGWVRDPSHLASRRPVRLYLPRFRRAVYLPAGRRAGRSDGRAVPRTGRPAGTDRKSDRGGGRRVPEDAFDGHQPARGRHQQGSLGRQRHDRRQRCVSAVRMPTVSRSI